MEDWKKKFKVLRLFHHIQASISLRRMTHGKRVNSDKNYVVYLVESNQSIHNYNNWLCGGALISHTQVLTAASCLTETHLYVIAGYKKYVNGRAIELDKCTKDRKNRVIRTCIPKNYNFSYSDQAQWLAVDVGVAIVENPYNFTDKTWTRFCSYTPKPIRISFHRVSYDTDVVSFGWGGSFWRTATDVLDNNSIYLQEMASMVAHKKKCYLKYDREDMKMVITKYMVCVQGDGNLDSDGVMQDNGPKTRQGCRRSEKSSGCRSNDSQNKSEEITKPLTPTRRQALCQNDHGGPLVTWIGTEEVLIGVASTSIVDAITLECTQPSLFTSMHCTGNTIQCLTAMTSTSRRKCAEEMKESQIEIQDNNIDWGTQHDMSEYKDSQMKT